MPALYRAVAIEEAQGLAVRVGKDLHFHVASLGKVALHEQAVIAKGPWRARRCADSTAAATSAAEIDHLHALCHRLPALGLDDQRKSYARAASFHEALCRLLQRRDSPGATGNAPPPPWQPSKRSLIPWT